ncbi:imidazole glycerol phosphate synthase subunit HisH [Rossellomorea vietnamensis]|uniref:Imidazole glycerol phosphate synthase subunit HisH n=1 Tax=Rossellomorea vietnamensis TaxID=218284 RepID=A0A6I6UT41_9BACI|nr:imidazole glycerol phosphate synthase subunit HisH [Rossellomorea vietnamensis]QHE63139.1 imidazole glycerol phosphate synthase subunit HisH [Rossellomorea vietnamensis]
MIGIVDYGMGNLFSVSKALERLNVPYFISDVQEELLSADGLILPGVGAFKDAMSLLEATHLKETILTFAESGKPLLGICLGMQLLFEESKENGTTKGLALLPGEVFRIPKEDREGNAYKVPHMGWNLLRFQKSSTLLEGLTEGYVYFVHSYYVHEGSKDVIAASTEYARVEIPAVVSRGNIYGMQFHPEKSGGLGMQLLENFTKRVKERVS